MLRRCRFAPSTFWIKEPATITSQHNACLQGDGLANFLRSTDGQYRTLTESPAGGQEKTPSPSTGDEAECSLAICEHIKPSGTGCGSPALRDQKFCYYHSKVRKTVPKNNLFVFLDNPGCKENDPYWAFEFPYLEDAAAVQIAFMQFIYGVSQHRMEEWRARMICRLCTARRPT